MSALASKSGVDNYPSTVSQFERVFSSRNDHSESFEFLDLHQSGSHWDLEHLKYFRVLAKVHSGPVSHLQTNYSRCQEAIANSSREKDLQSFYRRCYYIRKDYGDSQKSLASDGSHNQWPRAARQASQNKTTTISSSPFSLEQASSPPPKTGHSGSAYSDSRDIFQNTHFQIATTRFTKEYLKSYLVPGYDSDLSSEDYYLTVDLSYRRDVAKRTHRRDAIVMMASLIDYLYNVHIINTSPILSSTVGDGLDGHQAAGHDTGGSGDFLPRPEDENPDYLMEDGEGNNEEDLANEDRENYGGNQMDEDYDAESYPRHDLGGNFVDELSYIVAPAPTKRRKL
ncbi:hypothetical protein TWF173_009058 [Orbilia oligospora]|nr:hypothetical protein TWF173_009058 [Orbilia oligospora]